MADFIDRILEGQYKKENGTIEFSCASVEVNAVSGTETEGTFMLYAQEGIVTEGRIYSSDARMECITDSFSGAQDEIGYRFHAGCVDAGQTIKGRFTAVSNQGEYTLPFIVHVVSEVMMSGIGEIRNLFHFVNLAKSDWDEALRIFYSDEFKELFTDNDRQYYAAYCGLSGIPGNSHNMEEFLIEINKKKKIEFIPEQKEIKLINPSENENHTLKISCNGWGYIHLTFETDGDFIRLEHKEASEGNFLGNEYFLEYYIDNARLHEGRNYGEIRIRYCHDLIRIPVTVENGTDRRQVRRAYRAKEEITVHLMQYYQAKRAKKISTKTWLAESGKLVDALEELDPHDIAVQLYKAQLLITEERMNEARWILDRAELVIGEPGTGTPELECYCMYLRSLVEQNEEITRTAAENISAIYTVNSESWRVAFLLMQVSEEFTSSPSRKWLFIGEQLAHGCCSPVIYIEACRLIAKTPTLLTKLEGTELQILRYAALNGMMTRDILLQCELLSRRMRTYSHAALDILEHSYRELPDDELLSVICSQLIAGGCTDRSAFEWYSTAVSQQLRITNLYDYYLMAMPHDRDIEIPRMILMYFSYQSDLEYPLTAFLYAYVWKNRERFPEIFEQYHPRITQFTLDIHEKGRTDENLAYLYCNVVENDQFTEHIAENFTKIMFIREFSTEDEDIRSVYVVCTHLNKTVKTPVTGGKAQIAVYEPSSAVILEDADGMRFTGTVGYTLRELINPVRERIHVSSVVRNDPGLDDFMCYGNSGYMPITADNAGRLRRMIVSSEFNISFMRDYSPKLVKFYYENDRMDDLDTFLAMLTTDMVSGDSIEEIVSYFTKRGMYEKAYEWLQYISPDRVDPRILLRLCSELVKKKPELSDDSMLQQYMMTALKQGKYDDVTLNALISGYSGSIRRMRDIWKAAGSFDVDTVRIDARILTQMLYTGSYIAERWDILREYIGCSGINDRLVKATAAQCSYDYFARERVMDGELFSLIGRYAADGGEIPFVCGLAYVQYYSENPGEIDRNVHDNIVRFLKEQRAEGIVLPCYREFTDYLPFMMEFSDKTIIGYHAKRGSSVRIHYIREQEEGEEGDYTTEDMHEVYDGFFVRTFVLFFGERLQYYISQSEGGREQLTDSGTLSRSDIGTAADNRFNDINNIMIARNLQDYDTVDTLLKEYYRRDYIVSNLFHRK